MRMRLWGLTGGLKMGLVDDLVQGVLARRGKGLPVKHVCRQRQQTGVLAKFCQHGLLLATLGDEMGGQKLWAWVSHGLLLLLWSKVPAWAQGEASTGCRRYTRPAPIKRISTSIIRAPLVAQLLRYAFAMPTIGTDGADA